MIKEQIKKDLVKVLKKLRISPEKLVLEHPANPEHGDYSTNIAMQVRKKGYPAPWDLANKIVNTWRSQGLPEYLAKIEVAKPGFINIWIKTEVLGSEIERVLKEKGKYGSSNIGKGKGIMFEFSHPNTHKLFHIGHLRTTCLGESLSRIYETLGYKVVRTNYQGDVGLHIAKCLWGIKKLGMRQFKTIDGKMNFLAKAYTEGNRAYEKSKKAKKEITEINEKIYQQNDPKIMGLWKKTRKWSLDYFDRIYKRLDTGFDRFYFEGEVAEPGRKIVLEGLKKGIFKKSEGAIIFPGEKYGLHNRVFINQLGLPTYEAKDMALGKLQFSEFDVERIIHVVGPEQKGYFEVVFKALEELFPKTQGKEYHLEYGWVRLKEGKISSRTGEVITAEWLIDEAKSQIQKILKGSGYSKKEKEAIAEAVAVGAVKYWILKFAPSSEIAFDIKKSIDLEGDSAPYLQYTYARCQSVLRKAEVKTPLPEILPQLELEEVALLRTIYKFPEVVVEAGESFAPNLICNFLFDLAQKYNLFYNKHSILKAAQPELVKFRLALTAATAQVLKNGLGLLGIQTPKRM